MTTIKPIALALLLALACKPGPTVDATTTTGSSPTQTEPTPAGVDCYAEGPDGSLQLIPCVGQWPREPPSGAVPIVGICCSPGGTPCWAVEKAIECPPDQDFYPCEWGYETVDANGQPTVVCFD